ncbi:MAG: hypothetical protein ABJN84_07100 [Flavobacteriaceae bacterium]
MKKIMYVLACSCIFLVFFGCSSSTIEPIVSDDEIADQTDDDASPVDDTPDPMDDETSSDLEVIQFEGTGALNDFVTNNESALPEVGRVDGRYRGELTDNADNITLHFNAEQGRLDAKLVSFPFEFIARNIGVGTIDNSQIAPTPSGSLYIFSGVQVHVENLDSFNSAHVVVGHRGDTHYTIEGKNTVDGNSSVNDIGANTVPDGRADIRIVGNEDHTISVYWQVPNLDYETTNDDWSAYNSTGNLPGTAPTFGSNVYVGLITYAFGTNGVPFAGTCDAIQMTGQ